PRRQTVFFESTRDEPRPGSVARDLARSAPRSNRAYLRADRSGRTRVARTGIDHASARNHGARRGILSGAKPGTFPRGHDRPRIDDSIAGAPPADTQGGA